MGSRGGSLVSLGIVFSVLGVNAGSALVAPRCLYALAYEGHLPRFVSWVHPERRTPVVAILISAAVTLLIALSGSYIELAVISVVARFTQYIPTCLAVIFLRAKRPDEKPAFRVPWGPVIPILAIVLCAWLLIESEPTRLLWGLAGLASGLLIYIPRRLGRARS